MAAVKITDNVYWVGAIDWNVRVFHGYKVPYGTTYNAYLVLDEKVTLIDTVKAQFYDEMLKNISEIIAPEKIDILISNHVEPDHSGALPEIAGICRGAQIYSTQNGEKGLKAYYGELGNGFHIVKKGDGLCTGRYNFEFVPMPMVHWPDSMSTYLREEKILFSNDAFGQHIASNERFDDELGLMRMTERAADYYANIVLPFGAPVKKLLDDVSRFEFSYICPSHGAVLRSFIGEMSSKYAFWADGGFYNDRAVIVFDTMWESTRMMAESIDLEFRKKGVETAVFDLRKRHISEALCACLEAKYICVGSPTLNRNMMPSVAGFLCYLRGLAPKERTGLAFGSYGWSGESVAHIEAALSELKYEMLPAGKAVYRPH